jgi:hypothetical protein
MKEFDEDRRLIRAYLLGELDEQRQQQLEERFFTDPNYLKTILITEDELTEDFVFDLLPESQQAQFLDHFLATPQQRQKLKLVRGLKDYVARGATKPSAKERLVTFLRGRNAIVGFSFAAALVLVSLIGFWVYQSRTLEREIARLNGLAPDDRSALQADPSVYPVILTPRLRALGEGNDAQDAKLSIPLRARVVQFLIGLTADNYQRYRVELKRSDDTELFAYDNFTASMSDGGKLLSVKVPARVLTPGDYQLIISGVSSDRQYEYIGSYTFRLGDGK